MGPQTNDLIATTSSGRTSRRNEANLPQVSEEASDTYSMKGFNNNNLESTHERMAKRGITLGKRQFGKALNLLPGFVGGLIGDENLLKPPGTSQAKRRGTGFFGTIEEHSPRVNRSKAITPKVSLQVRPKNLSKATIDMPEEEPDDPVLQFKRFRENKRGPVVFEKQISKDKLISQTQFHHLNERRF